MPRPKSPKEMGDAIKRNLPARTGGTFEEWVALARKEALPTRRQTIAWLKTTHGLGTVTATFIAAEAEGKSIVDTYADSGALLDGMYSGEKAVLRPLYDQLTKLARGLGKDVDLTVCKTYVGIRRAKQFALVRPTTKTRVDLGLALPDVKPAGRLLAAGSIGSDRMTHRIPIATRKEIDSEVRRWLKAAYDLSTTR
jgi:Domain of unknown function (DUF5655)/Domain of unknown function (DUF4287)